MLKLESNFIYFSNAIFSIELIRVICFFYFSNKNILYGFKNIKKLSFNLKFSCFEKEYLKNNQKLFFFMLDCCNKK